MTVDEQVEDGQAEAGATPERKTATYVVQRLVTLPDGMEANSVLGALTASECWVDIGMVAVAPKSPRKTAIRNALQNAGIKPEAGMDKLTVRALDVDSFREVEIPVVVREPEFDI